jgi:hypothetical protein
MTRIAELKKEITDNFISHEEIIEAYGLDTTKSFEEQFSKASLESIMFYNDAYRALLIEELFKHNLEMMDEKIRNQRVHTLGWYRTTALEFQYGKEFREDLAEYDNAGMTDEEIEAQRIIKKCSVTKAETYEPTLIVKVHKADGKLGANEKTAFEAYMADKADAGVHVSIISENADRLVLYVTIRYDAMLMDGNGMRFSDGKSPVQDAVKSHLNNLEFNGTFYPSMLEQEWMRQTGIRVATIRMAMAGSDGLTPAEFIDEYAPLSGAIDIDTETDLYVTYGRF